MLAIILLLRNDFHRKVLEKFASTESTANNVQCLVSFLYYIWSWNFEQCYNYGFSWIFQLRLLYECIPMSFIIEQAGGLATTGTAPILDIVPEKIHQRVAIFLGSKDDVQDVIDLYSKHAKSNA